MVFQLAVSSYYVVDPRIRGGLIGLNGPSLDTVRTHTELGRQVSHFTSAYQCLRSAATVSLLRKPHNKAYLFLVIINFWAFYHTSTDLLPADIRGFFIQSPIA
uniref:Uncharacterized protein n=1 Tax=Gibberella zeae TaxID=5518 RepID=A0A4E9EEE1_GIBZA